MTKCMGIQKDLALKFVRYIYRSAKWLIVSKLAYINIYKPYKKGGRQPQFRLN